jgi:hypothetical protein
VPLRRAFTVEIEVPAANESHRARSLGRMLGPTTNQTSLDSDGLRAAAQSMAGFLPCDLAAMACDATLAVLREKMNDGAEDVVRVLLSPAGYVMTLLWFGVTMQSQYASSDLETCLRQRNEHTTRRFKREV